MDYIIANEPSVTGIVVEIDNDFASIQIEDGGDVITNGSTIQVSLDVECADSHFGFEIGDEVVVYYGDNVTEDTASLKTIYAITLRTPASRTELP